MRARPTSPHTSIYRFRHTMLLSFAHRIAGVLMAFGLIVLSAWLMAAAGGESSYNAAVGVLGMGFFRLLLWVLLASFLYHLVNGVRHLTWDFALGMEKRQARVSSAIVVVLVVLLLALFTYLLFCPVAP